MNSSQCDIIRYHKNFDIDLLNERVFKRESKDKNIIGISSALKFSFQTSQDIRNFYRFGEVDISNLQETTAAALSTILTLLEVENDEVLARSERKTINASVEKIAETIASSLFIFCHSKFQEGRLKKASLRKPLTKSVLRYRNDYVSLLKLSLNCTKKNDVQALVRLAEKIIFQIFSEVGDLLVLAGASSETDQRRKKFHGVEVSDLSRRYIMLTISLLNISMNMKDPYQKHHVLRASKRFRQVWREDMQLRNTASRVGTESTDASVKGKLNYVKFYNRHNKPFTSANIVGTSNILIAPYKSLLRMGVTNGSSFWAKGKIKSTKSGQKIFEVEYEGLKPHANKYWEDYLAYKYKSIFELYPNAYRMAYEFPDLRRTDAFFDLQSRVKK